MDRPLDYVFAWQMRRPETDMRRLAHLRALRDTRREGDETRSPLVWIADRLGFRSQARIESCSMRTCVAAG